MTTQRRTLVGDRVDIEVRYGPGVRPELVVWLELKWDAIPDAEQLARYALALEKLRYRRTALGLVAPRGAVVPEDAPGRHGTWNDWVGSSKDGYGEQSGPTRMHTPSPLWAISLTIWRRSAWLV